MPQRGLIGISPMAKITQRPIEALDNYTAPLPHAVDVSPQIAISQQHQANAKRTTQGPTQVIYGELR